MSGTQLVSSMDHAQIPADHAESAGELTTDTEHCLTRYDVYYVKSRIRLIKRKLSMRLLMV